MTFCLFTDTNFAKRTKRGRRENSFGIFMPRRPIDMSNTKAQKEKNVKSKQNNTVSSPPRLNTNTVVRRNGGSTNTRSINKPGYQTNVRTTGFVRRGAASMPQKRILGKTHFEKEFARISKDLSQSDSELLREMFSNSHPDHKKEKKEEKAWWQEILDVGKSVIPHIAPMLLGMGDYDEDVLTSAESPKTNSFLAASTGGKVGSEVPYMHEDGAKTRVVHREYLGDLYSTTSAFKQVNYAINPGMNETFPWASPIANQFTKYRMLGATVEFVSEGSEYSNAAGLGYVAIATRYDALAPKFNDKRTMLNSQFADACKPSKSFTHWIECKSDIVGDMSRYCRSGEAPTESDLRLYDLGEITIAVGGNTVDDSIIGEIWISYDVELTLPKAGSLDGANNEFFVASSSDSVSNARLFGVTQDLDSRNTFSMDLTRISEMRFPNNLRGMFRVEYGVNLSAGDPAPTMGPAVGTNCIISGQTVTGLVANSLNYMLSFYVEIRNDGAAVTITNVSLANWGNMWILIVQIPELPALESGGILDKQGKLRTVKYEEFIKRFRSLPEPEWVTVRTVKNFAFETKKVGEKVFRRVYDGEGHCAYDVSRDLMEKIAFYTADELLTVCKNLVLDKKITLK